MRGVSHFSANSRTPYAYSYSKHGGTDGANTRTDVAMLGCMPVLCVRVGDQV